MLENKTPSQDAEEHTTMTLSPTEVTPEEKEEEQQEIIEETLKYSGVETFIVAALVAIAVAASFFLFSNNLLRLSTEDQLIVYMFAMLVAPSSYFLLTLHMYSLIRELKNKKKPVLLPLDLFFLFYIPIAASTLYYLYYIYQKFAVSIDFLSFGWSAGALLLFVEVVLAYFISRWIIISTSPTVFPHLIPIPASEQPAPKPKPYKPKMHSIDYPPVKHPEVQKKANHAVWQDHPSFVKYQDVMNDKHHPIP